MKKKLLTQKHLLSGLIILAMFLTMLPATSMEAKAASMSKPGIVEDSGMKAGQEATWDCVWFGAYPQTEIVSKKSQCGTVGRYFATASDYEENASLYSKLQSASYNAKGDTTVDGVKYRRIKEDDVTFAASENGNYYNWSDSSTYHYFRYEKIKWRVLNTDGSTVLLLADQALDAQRYNKILTSVTWETSTIRSWLNGYGSDSNTDGIDYSSKNFIESAFTKAEQGIIKPTTVINDDNINYGTTGGNSTTDKIFLLSESEVYNTETAKSYGFVKNYDTKDEARRCQSSTYAKAMGVWSDYGDGVGFDGNCYWWLRSPGNNTNCAALVFQNGYVNYTGYKVFYDDNGMRPALKLNLSSSDLYSYAGTVSSDGSYKETTIPKKPTLKSLTAGKRKLTVKMSCKPSDKNASKYEIAYKEKGKSKWKTITTSSKSKDIKKLKKSKKYYVKVRAYNKLNGIKCYGAWSKTKLSKKIK